MALSTDKILAIVPEGPIAHDGTRYRYSKGERKYIEGLTPYFKEVIIISFVFRKGDVYYEACSHSAFTAPNLRVIELPKASANPTVAQKCRQFSRVLWVFAREVRKVDLLYLFLPGYPSAMAWLAARLWRRQHFVYAADDWEQATPGMFKWEHLRGSALYHAFAWSNRTLEQHIAKSALFCVTAGKSLLVKYARYGRPVAETTPRMTLSADDLYEREDTCHGERLRLINVASLAYDKAQHVLLEALAMLRHRRSSTIDLDLVGEGPRAQELKAEAERLGLSDCVSFHGHVQAEADLYSLYKAADIFVLSSVSEGFPRVLYEAMAMHLPIVTTNVGGIAQLMVDGVNAAVVPPNDPALLADAIEKVSTDGDYRRRIIGGGAETVKEVLQRMNPRQIPLMLAETCGAQKE